MLKRTIVALLLAGCAGQTQAPDPHPCFTRTAREFSHQQVDCQPEQADVCVFDVHNRATALDGSGEPMSYSCVCTAANTYSCWGSPDLPAPDALP